MIRPTVFRPRFTMVFLSCRHLRPADMDRHQCCGSCHYDADEGYSDLFEQEAPARGPYPSCGHLHTEHGARIVGPRIGVKARFCCAKDAPSTRADWAAALRRYRKEKRENRT